MKVILLAAGEGKRMSPAFPGPKSLLPLSSGETILSRLVRQLAGHEIVLVVGYRKEEIRSAFPLIPSIENPLFAKENTAKSLLRALSDVDDDVIWINGDVVCRDEVMEAFFQQVETKVVVNHAETGDEEVKYRTSGGKVASIGKHLSDAEGESVGIQMVCQEHVPILREALEVCEENDYFEVALQRMVDEGVAIRPFVIGEDEAVEVDFPEDWERAKELVTEWYEKYQP